MRSLIVPAICLILFSSSTFSQALQPVSVVADQMNRVNPKKIIFADAAAARKPIGGRFKLDQPGSLVHGLEYIYPDIQVIETKYGWIVKTRKKH